MLLLHTCFFFGGEFLQFSFMSVFNWKSPTHAEQPAKDLLSACIHAFVDEFQGNLAARNWKKGQRSWEFSLVAEIFGKSFEHHLSMVFCFLFDLILKKMIHDIFFFISFYMLLVIGCIFLPLRWYWLEVCLDSRRKPRCGRRTRPCFEARGSRMSHHGKSYSDTDGLQEMRPQIFGVLVFASKLLAQDSHMYFEFIM